MPVASHPCSVDSALVGIRLADSGASQGVIDRLMRCCMHVVVVVPSSIAGAQHMRRPIVSRTDTFECANAHKLFWNSMRERAQLYTHGGTHTHTFTHAGKKCATTRETRARESRTHTLPDLKTHLNFELHMCVHVSTTRGSSRVSRVYMFVCVCVCALKFQCVCVRVRANVLCECPDASRRRRVRRNCVEIGFRNKEIAHTMCSYIRGAERAAKEHIYYTHKRARAFCACTYIYAMLCCVLRTHVPHIRVIYSRWRARST